jgi:hypothetical protein
VNGILLAKNFFEKSGRWDAGSNGWSLILRTNFFFILHRFIATLLLVLQNPSYMKNLKKTFPKQHTNKNHMLEGTLIYHT